MSRLSTNPQSSDGMARGPAQIPVPQKWQVDQGALQMNFLATTLLTEMAKYNNIIHSYYNSMLLEQKHLKSVIYDLESIINDLQSKVQDAEIKRVKTEERLRALQVDYEQLATFHNQNPSMVCTRMFDRRTNL